MRRRSGRQVRRRFQQGRLVPGIRRYLLCQRNDASDTDSDSIPLSSLLDDAADDTADSTEDSTTLLTQMNSDVGNINPAVCTGLLQMYSTTDAAADSLADRMSMLHSAMPLFTNHLQLPLFTGQRRWHTMFGQLSQLTSRGCVGTLSPSVDEDVLADSNFASLFESSVEQMNNEDARYMQSSYHSSHASCVATQGCQTLEASPEVTDFVESNLSALDENVDDVQSSMEHFVVDANVHQSDDNANCESESVSVTDARHSCELTVNVNRLAHGAYTGGEHDVQCVGSHSASSGSQSRALCGRRHSDPGSIHSSTNGSLSMSSNSDDWYYYDRRLGPGGELAALYGRLRTRRSLSVIVFPPAYDDVVCNAPASPSVAQHTTDPSSELTVSESAGSQLAELPPPYHESERPPSYSEITDTADVNEPLDTPLSQALSTRHEYSQLSCAQNCRGSDDNVLLRGCSQSHRMFVGRPAVRWNRNTRIERWTSSSFNWVMS